MLRRSEDLGDDVHDRTYQYWLGLNQIAEERGGDGAAVLHASPEVGPDPDDDGWYIYSDDTISYPTDTERGKVTRLTGDAYFGMALAVIGDSGSNFNPNDTPFATTNKTVGLWVRNADDDVNPEMRITVVFVDDQAVEREARFISGTGTDTISGVNFEFYIGDEYEQAGWRFFEQDIQARVAELDGGVIVDELRAVVFIGEDLYVDDLILGTGTLEKSYQLIPGAMIMGTLGAQSGSRGGDGGMGAWSRWYYHYNDLGTVLATTDDAGDEIGVYEPRFYGQYLVVSGVRPDTMGLTGKFLDEATGLYDFGARWYDPDRGSWMSREPLGLDGPNEYHFVFNDPSYAFDPTGRATVRVDEDGDGRASIYYVPTATRDYGIPIYMGEGYIYNARRYGAPSWDKHYPTGYWAGWHFGKETGKDIAIVSNVLCETAQGYSRRVRKKPFWGKPNKRGGFQIGDILDAIRGAADGAYDRDYRFPTPEDWTLYE